MSLLPGRVVADTIRAIASLLWPVLVILALLVFRRPLGEVVRSLGQRKMTVEVAGQKLTFEEYREQQTKQIEDLQAQLGAVHRTVVELAVAQPTRVNPPAAPETVLPRPLREESQGSISEDLGAVADQPFAVLWVDDHPANNALLVEQLQKNGVRVDLARSTQEALSRFSHRRYRAILSDMHRFENGADTPDAGIYLVKAIRKLDQSIPFLVYCSPHAVQDYGEKALEVGATKVTASPYQVTEDLRALGLL